MTKPLVKTPKRYFLDTGLCAYLTQWSSPQTLEAGATSPARDALRHMAALERWGVPCAPGAVLCMVSEILPLGLGMTAVPVGSV